MGKPIVMARITKVAAQPVVGKWGCLEFASPQPSSDGRGGEIAGECGLFKRLDLSIPLK